MKILAIGDIHTKTWIIDAVEKIADQYDAVVFCGDYADNWNTGPSHIIATWRDLKMLMEEKTHVQAVIGNHDFAYIHPEIAGRSSGWDPITYQLINAPENKKIKNWLVSLPVIIELDDVSFSHAGITNGWNGGLDVQSLWQEESPIWARPAKYGGRVTYKEIPQVVGHNASEHIWEISKNVWCIDTFSEHRDNTPIGDYTVLEIIDGKQFNIIKLKEKQNDNNSNTTNFETQLS